MLVLQEERLLLIPMVDGLSMEEVPSQEKILVK
jgi:hypothetical protein